VVRLESFSPRSRIVPYKEEGFCGMDGKYYNTSLTTEEEQAPGALESSFSLNSIMHKGPCGICSNPHDYEIYKSTRLTLTRTATLCAASYLLLGETSSRLCMKHLTNLTDSCVECWISNIQCTTAQCAPICVKYFVQQVLWKNVVSSFYGFQSHENVKKNNLEENSEQQQIGKTVQLNPCYQCDEIQCGPAFKKCSGLNRRNAGFVTDIERPEEEIWKRNP
ncbi:hypothetical protein C9374_004394, partial [Naegleria lovaniensis]